uniref:Uncharacterized protein n=1 Tax=Anguilla anguilla TaxID=7936 RepID=A0A0E9R9S1_ANGAN
MIKIWSYNHLINKAHYLPVALVFIAFPLLSTHNAWKYLFLKSQDAQLL